MHLLELSVEVVEPRKLTALEWVLLRVVDEFSTAPPPLAEVADELGLDRPEFLRDTLKELLRLRAVAPRDPALRVVDLDTVAFTDTGVALYRRGKIEGEPATRGITVLIDALTDEDLPPPTSQKKQTAGSNTMGTRQTFGLDRTRDVMHRFHADILRGDAEVRAVTVRSSIDSERAVDLHFSFTSDGALSVDSGELSTAALAQLRERDLIAEDLIPRRAASEAWTEPLTPRDSASSNFAGWRTRTTRTLPSSTIAAEAIAQIRQARRELVLHALWLEAPGVRAAVDAARTHGVHVLVASAGVTRLDLKPHGAHLSCEVQATSAILLPGALIIDGFAGLLLADIELGWQGQPVICELGGSLNEATARAVRDALVEASLAAIDHDVVLSLDPATSARVRSPVLDLLAPLPGFPAHVAGLLFRGSLTHVEALQQRVATHHRGLQRLAAQRALHGLGGALALEFPVVVWEEPWNTSWQQCFADLRDVHPLPLEPVRALLALAPPNLRAAAFIGPAVATWVPATSAVVDRGALVALRQIAELSAQRWEAGIARSDPAWTAARDHWLTPDELIADSVVILASEASSLLGPDEVSVWASRILATLPRPPSFETSEPWLRGALALRPMIGAPWDAHVLEVWRALLAADPDDQETAIARGLALLRVEELAPLFLAQATDAGQVLALRHRFQQARADTLRAPLWAAALRARLPKLASTFRAREHGPLVRSLAVGVTEWPEGKTIVSTWVQTIADNLRQAADLPALVFWLDELGALGPALATTTMSMTGHQRLELERQRLEELRLIQASQECTVLAEACEQHLRGIHDVAVQQLAAAELQRIAAGLSLARTQIAAQPDITLPRLQELQTQLQRVVVQAEARARAWSDEQTELIARSRSSTALATAAGATTSSPDRALQHAAEAARLAEEGRLDEARAALAAAQSGADEVRQNVLDEQVRITIVQGLIRSLGEMGFILVDPYLTNTSVVVLEGRMASGRRARFEVQLDGRMEFDLDGYEGQACADDIERVATVLRDQYGVRLGPPQVTWKNPDRLTQGALRGPAGQGGSKGAT